MRRGHLERIIPSESFANEPHLAYFKYLARYGFASQWVGGKRVLDAGCGTGYGTAFLAQKGAQTVIGIDVSSEAIDYARKHYQGENLSFQLMDCEKLEFPDEAFDVVCAIEVIEHLGDPEAFLVEAQRVLKPGGLFILSTPNRAKSDGHPSKWFNIYHQREFYYGELSGLLGKHFSAVEFFGEEIGNPDFGRYYQSVDQFRRRIPFFIRKLVPERLRIILRQRLFGKLPMVDPKDFYYSKENVEDSECLLVRCTK